jgi:hypothetical protein
MSYLKNISLDKVNKNFPENVTLPFSGSLEINSDVTFGFRFFPVSVKYQSHYNYIDTFCVVKPIILYIQNGKDDRGYIIVAANLTSIAEFYFPPKNKDSFDNIQAKFINDGHAKLFDEKDFQIIQRVPEFIKFPKKRGVPVQNQIVVEDLISFIRNPVCFQLYQLQLFHFRAISSSLQKSQFSCFNCSKKAKGLSSFLQHCIVTHYPQIWEHFFKANENGFVCNVCSSFEMKQTTLHTHLISRHPCIIIEYLEIYQGSNPNFNSFLDELRNIQPSFYAEDDNVDISIASESSLSFKPSESPFSLKSTGSSSHYNKSPRGSETSPHLSGSSHPVSSSGHRPQPQPTLYSTFSSDDDYNDISETDILLPNKQFPTFRSSRRQKSQLDDHYSSSTFHSSNHTSHSSHMDSSNEENYSSHNKRTYDPEIKSNKSSSRHKISPQNDYSNDDQNSSSSHPPRNEKQISSHRSSKSPNPIPNEENDSFHSQRSSFKHSNTEIRPNKTSIRNRNSSPNEYSIDDHPKPSSSHCSFKSSSSNLKEFHNDNIDSSHSKRSSLTSHKSENKSNKISPRHKTEIPQNDSTINDQLRNPFQNSINENTFSPFHSSIESNYSQKSNQNFTLDLEMNCSSYCPQDFETKSPKKSQKINSMNKFTEMDQSLSSPLKKLQKINHDSHSDEEHNDSLFQKQFNNQNSAHQSSSSSSYKSQKAIKNSISDEEHMVSLSQNQSNQENSASQSSSPQDKLKNTNTYQSSSEEKQSNHENDEQNQQNLSLSNKLEKKNHDSFSEEKHNDSLSQKQLSNHNSSPPHEFPKITLHFHNSSEEEQSNQEYDEPNLLHQSSSPSQNTRRKKNQYSYSDEEQQNLFSQQESIKTDFSHQSSSPQDKLKNTIKYQSSSEDEQSNQENDEPNSSHQSSSPSPNKLRKKNQYSYSEEEQKVSFSQKQPRKQNFVHQPSSLSSNQSRNSKNFNSSFEEKQSDQELDEQFQHESSSHTNHLPRIKILGNCSSLKEELNQDYEYNNSQLKNQNYENVNPFENESNETYENPFENVKFTPASLTQNPRWFHDNVPMYLNSFNPLDPMLSQTTPYTSSDEVSFDQTPSLEPQQLNESQIIPINPSSVVKDSFYFHENAPIYFLGNNN